MTAQNKDNTDRQAKTDGQMYRGLKLHKELQETKESAIRSKSLPKG